MLSKRCDFVAMFPAQLVVQTALGYQSLMSLLTLEAGFFRDLAIKINENLPFAKTPGLLFISKWILKNLKLKMIKFV